MKGMMKVFVSAYACEPGLGSEIGVGWHWVLEMSKYFELWVLTRQSNRSSIEPWIEKHPEFAGIHFLYYDLPGWARFWKKGLRGVRIYYNIWQRMTDSIVKRTMQDNDIHIFHHLTYGNAVWQVSRYGQKQFFIWGPIGGLETIPEEYSRGYGLKDRILERLRRVMVARAVKSCGFRKRCKNADLILCKTEITRQQIPVEYRDKGVLMTDVAADILAQRPAGKERSNGSLNFITVGRLDAWRGFDLCIEALARVTKSGRRMTLTIVGDGSDRERLEALAEDLGISEWVTFTGKVCIEDYFKLMEEADVVVNVALKEGAVTVSFDAMAMGKPLICLNTTGYTRNFSDKYARVLQLGADRDETIRYIAFAMEEMLDDDTRSAMSRNARTAAQNFSWDIKGKEIIQLLKARFHEEHID